MEPTPMKPMVTENRAETGEEICICDVVAKILHPPTLNPTLPLDFHILKMIKSFIV
jgi:hypothetical protein